VTKRLKCPITTQVISQALQEVGKGMAKKVSIQHAENLQGWCGRDVAW